MHELLKRITVNPSVMTGLPCIWGVRIPATTIPGLLAVGATEKKILTDYPDLEPYDLKAGMAFVAWLTREREIELQHT
jgi:uncharacterized protein (DUF433 family)